LPSAFVSLPDEEKAFVIAAIDIKVEEDRKEQKKYEKEAAG
jgi:hypothetical protein